MTIYKVETVFEEANIDVDASTIEVKYFDSYEKAVAYKESQDKLHEPYNKNHYYWYDHYTQYAVIIEEITVE